MRRTVLVTGANRGIGLEFVKQCIAAGDEVLATCRDMNKAQALTAVLGQSEHSQLYQLDVTQSESLDVLTSDLKDKPIDLLINNAGIYCDHQSSFTDLTFEQLAQSFTTNVFAVFALTQRLLPNILRSQHKKIVNLSSILGSIESNTSGSSPAYCASKAGLNALMRSAGITLADSGVQVFLFHPGWVNTDMGGALAPVTPEISVKGMLKLITQGKTPIAKGYWDYQGQLIPW